MSEKEKKSKFNKTAYQNAFILQSYDRINLTVPKGKKEVIKTIANNCNKSVNGFINEAIDEKIERNK